MTFSSLFAPDRQQPERGELSAESGDRSEDDQRRSQGVPEAYAYGDEAVWAAIRAKLSQLKGEGRQQVRILDVGCGSGVWLRRAILRARLIGFTRVEAQGFDSDPARLAEARRALSDMASLRGVTVRLENADRFDASAPQADLCLCLSGMLNRYRPDELEPVLASIAKHTRGWLVASVHGGGDASAAHKEEVSPALHLFRSTALRSLMEQAFEVEDLVGLDLFHARFANDAQWDERQSVDTGFEVELGLLEDVYSHRPDFIDHAARLLLVARPRQAA